MLEMQGYHTRDIIPSAHRSAAPAEAGAITTALNPAAKERRILNTLHTFLQVHVFFIQSVFLWA